MSFPVRTGLLLTLTVVFLVYTFTLYRNTTAGDPVVAEGRLVWQKYNCQACHQLYGLGGYLGPDLTNVCSSPGKGELYIRALIQTGTKQMPAFQMSEAETTALIGFLKGVDATGDGRINSFQRHWNGMITGRYE